MGSGQCPLDIFSLGLQLRHERQSGHPSVGGQPSRPSSAGQASSQAREAFAITSFDADAPPRGWAHWVVVGLPACHWHLPK